MAHDPSRTQSLFPMETCPQVSDEAFNLFHSIDRQLYTRLIHNLSRDPAESVQVMAFWMWLEREGNDMNLVRRMLALPPALLSQLAYETAACLKCVENDEFMFGDGNVYNEIILLPELLGGGGDVFSLRFFHENRIAVLRGVSKIINTVCARAFNDIFMKAWRGGMSESGGGGGGAAPPVMPILYHPYLDVPFVPLPPAAGDGLIGAPPPLPMQPQVLPPGDHHAPPAAAVAEGISGIPIHLLAAGIFPVYDVGAQRQMLNNELGEMLSRNLTINNSTREENNNNNDGGYEQGEVPADDRTIFLTFSKGYPITEDEVKEFFTKKFGDFIEELIMQEVGEDEQVLYARMVARRGVVMEGIVGGNKAKYSINGKHVWARKYVKKQQQQQSPTRGDSSSPSSSTAPAGEQ